MHSYDLLMLLVLIGCTIFGAWKGMAWQIASLGSLLVSYLVALRFSDQLAPLLGTEEPWNRVVAMLILYVATAVVIWLAFRFVAKAIDRIKLREFDRQLGALFGASKGVLLCLVITFFAVSLSDGAKGMVRESKAGHYMARLLDHAHPLIPHEVHEVLHPYFEQLRDGVDPNAPPSHEHPEHNERPGAVAGQHDEPSGVSQASHDKPIGTDPHASPGPATSNGSTWDNVRRLLEGVQRMPFGSGEPDGSSNLNPTGPQPFGPSEAPAASSAESDHRT